MTVEVRGVAHLIEPELESNNFGQNAGKKSDLWMIMKRTSQHSLQTVIDRKREQNGNGIEIPVALKFIQNLTEIIKQIHSEGLLYQNISPENITLEGELTNLSIDKVSLTLVNFKQCCIKSNPSLRPKQKTLTQWYQPPQANSESFQYSSTIDASAIVAIFLWLLTNTIPQNDANRLPHQKSEVHEAINKKVAAAVLSQRM